MVTLAVMNSHSDSKIIDRIGGNSFVAAIFGCTSQYVSKWRKKGIPKVYRMCLKDRYPEAFSDEVGQKEA